MRRTGDLATWLRCFSEMEYLPSTTPSPATRNSQGLPKAVEAHCVTFDCRDYFSGVEPKAKPKPTPRVFLGCHLPLKATVSSSHNRSQRIELTTPPADAGPLFVVCGSGWAADERLTVRYQKRFPMARRRLPVPRRPRKFGSPFGFSCAFPRRCSQGRN